MPGFSSSSMWRYGSTSPRYWKRCILVVGAIWIIFMFHTVLFSSMGGGGGSAPKEDRDLHQHLSAQSVSSGEEEGTSKKTHHQFKKSASEEFASIVQKAFKQRLETPKPRQVRRNPVLSSNGDSPSSVLEKHHGGILSIHLPSKRNFSSSSNAESQYFGGKAVDAAKVKFRKLQKEQKLHHHRLQHSNQDWNAPEEEEISEAEIRKKKFEHENFQQLHGAVDDERAHSRDEDPTHLHVTIFTTLKPCTTDHIYQIQRAAIQSWMALDLISPPEIYLLESGECGERLANELPGVKVRDGAAGGPHGTLLLGRAVSLIQQESPNADIYGLINADILLASSCANALKVASSVFMSYFLIGRRMTVDIPTEARKTLDFSHPSWELNPTFKSVANDRIDAEDYFFWTPDFWTSKHVEIPNFHIGRPAYDNWLVHTALHTFQPVIDASAIMKAFHQKHDYSHLRQEMESGEVTPEEIDSHSRKNHHEKEEKRRRKKKYWGTQEQEENYQLATSHGGWQHGLIEFAPFRFACKKKKNESAAADREPHCIVNFKSDWQPLSNGQFGDMDFYVKNYRQYVLPGKRTRYDEIASSKEGMRSEK